MSPLVYMVSFCRSHSHVWSFSQFLGALNRLEIENYDILGFLGFGQSWIMSTMSDKVGLSLTNHFWTCDTVARSHKITPVIVVVVVS